MIDGLKPYPAMKDSGVTWLGMVPEHWEVRRLKQICRLAYGNALATDVREHGTVPVYGSNGCVGLHSSTNTKAPCIVIGRKGSFGKVNFSAEPVFAIDTTFFIDDRFSATNLRWLFYLLGWLRLDEVSKNSAVPGLDREDAYQRVAVLPPPDEQSAIARFLDHAGRRIRRYIRAKQKLIKLLEEERQAVIHQAVTRGLDPNVRLKPSGVQWLGDVPEHWDVRRLKYLSSEITVGVVVNPSSYFVDDGVPILLGNNVLPGRFKLDKVRRISVESNRVLRKSELHAGDVVVVRVGAPGVAAVVPDELEGCNCASMVIVRRGPEVEPRWIEHLFNSPMMRRQIDLVKYGAAQKQFNIAHAVEFWALVPDIEEQREILAHLARELSSVDLTVYQVTNEISLLREFRTRLIADVVTGKLDVCEAAAKLPDEPEDMEVLDTAEELEGGEVAGSDVAPDDETEEAAA